MGKPGTLGNAYGRDPGSNHYGRYFKDGSVSHNFKIRKLVRGSKTLRVILCPVRAGNRRHGTHYAIFVNGMDMSLCPDKRLSTSALDD